MPATDSAELYLDALEPERQKLVSAIRDTVNKSIDPGFEEMVEFGMLAWCVPLERYPDTYNGRPFMYAALGSQKRYVSLYLMGIYADPVARDWFLNEYQDAGRKPDMGKSCVRFRRLDDVPFDLISRAIARYSVDSFLDIAQRARST